jgi:WD40 repeat protein
VAFLPNDAPVSGIAFSPDARLLATASTDGVVRVWDVRTPSMNMQPTAVFNGGAGSVSIYNGGANLAFSPDSSLLAVGGDDGVLRLWDMVTESLSTSRRVLTSGQLLSVTFSPDGTVLGTAGGFHPATTGGPFTGQDNRIYLWDTLLLQTGQNPLLVTLPGHADAVTGLAFSPDGTVLASVSADRFWRLWGVR